MNAMNDAQSESVAVRLTHLSPLNRLTVAALPRPCMWTTPFIIYTGCLKRLEVQLPGQMLALTAKLGWPATHGDTMMLATVLGLWCHTTAAVAACHRLAITD